MRFFRVKNCLVASILVVVWIPLAYFIDQMVMSVRYGDHLCCVESATKAAFDGSPVALDHRGCFEFTVPFGKHRLDYETKDGRKQGLDLRLDEKSSTSSTLEVRNEKVIGL